MMDAELSLKEDDACGGRGPISWAKPHVCAELLVLIMNGLKDVGSGFHTR